MVATLVVAAGEEDVRVVVDLAVVRGVATVAAEMVVVVMARTK